MRDRRQVGSSRWLIAGALLLAAMAAMASFGETAPARSGFTILQMNDTYKIEGLEAGRVGGMARVRTVRRELEAAGRPVLVLHGGDFLFPSVMSKYLAGAAMVATLNRLDGSDGFDDRLFATFGNHEFDSPDLALLLARLEESRFGWLSANLGFRPPGASTPVPFAGHAPHVVATHRLELGGIEVGLFGLSMPSEPYEWTDYGDFERLVEAAASAVAELRGRGAEFVVALTHQAVIDDIRLAEQVGGIDWIVGGHEHVALARTVGGTRITKADADAKTLIRIDVDRGPGGLVTEHRKLTLDAAVAPDPELLGEVARWLVRLEERVRATTGRSLLEVVATTEHALEGIEASIRTRETALGNLITDVLRSRLATDVAILNAGGIRVNDDVPAGGELRVYELEGIFNYDNRPIAFELTGRELLELLRKSVSEASLGIGRFLQVAGIRFRYLVRREEGAEVAAVEPDDVSILRRGARRWQPLDLDRVYSVASVDWLWQNGCREGYPRFAAGCGGTSPARLERPPLSLRTITEEAIAAEPGQRIRARIDGRIVRVESSATGDER